MSATDKMAPDFLRSRHAGVGIFTSTERVNDLYPKLLQAAQDCREGRIKPGAYSGGAGGIVGTISSAERRVVGELSANGESATIMVRTIGFFGAAKANFFQIDLSRERTGTRIEAFHRMRYDKNFLAEVSHWLDGELDYCESNPYNIRASGGAK